jgi:acylglycerol lipase
MKHEEFSFHTKDGLNLYAQAWSPENPKAVVCLVHGLGEHSGRYVHVADRLNRSAYAFLASDLRGHGKSEGLRGHTPSFEAFLTDIDLLLEEAKRRYQDQPCFLYGHSLGGILVLNYTLQRHPELAGVIASSPGLRTALEQQKGKVALVKLLGSVMPKQSISSGLDATTLSRDTEVVKKYLNDPLVHDRITFGMAKALTETIPWVFAHASKFPVALLIMHGTADRLVFPAGSQEFAGLVLGDCTLKLWEGLYTRRIMSPKKMMCWLIWWLG